jgi:general secretion pathway protein N
MARATASIAGLGRARAAIAVSLAGQRGAALLLALLCCALAAIIAIELGGDAGGAATPSLDAAPARPLPPLPAAFGLPPLSSYAEVAERPLFSATRRRRPEEAGQDLLGKSSSFVLVGVVISQAGRVALVQHGHPGELARLGEGQAVEGWAVQSILPDRVVLQHGATEYELKLKDLPAAPGAPHAPPKPRG